MIANWLRNTFYGAIKVEVTGKLLSVLLNQLNRSGIPLLNVKRKSVESITFIINIQHFETLRTMVKNTESKIKIVRKIGIPFYNWRLKRRYMFTFGFVFFLLFIWTMSNVLWDIEIVGNNGKSLPYENEKIIREELENTGIRPGVWKGKLAEKDMIQSYMRETLQDRYVWIGMEIRGTKMLIIAVPFAKPPLQEKLAPSNIVATKQAVIRNILVHDGVAMVKAGKKVVPGEVLISGIVGAGKIIPAKGVVEGIVWYTVEVNVPLQREVETYTGESKKKYRLVLGNRELPLYLPSSLEVLQAGHDLKTVIRALSWRSLQFPIQLHVDTYFETKTQIIKLDEQEAKNTALAKASQKIKEQTDYLEVVSETIMKYNMDSEQVYLKLLAEVVEDITARKTITEQDILEHFPKPD
ncbi:hypothetical protein BHU72_11490 [Desulfuribacillus stibiiarsenatis]|uniref:Sporulation protein YqfD n=1 Tax=Desulfuribacillus stibiiarsenatis TaxID=1390249 RepID=A0A1E5L7M4_9FIRM|nr:sporulation protein YqfD [Desulfuribacillus stibiiarsenatis]OEH86157.1 hypothetical protein BHU72_11490 [Desulfuribacillus stibiiarsenatis]